MRYYHSWSGGKDSTAGIILDHMHGLPPSTIIFSEVMFDKKRDISGELPEHIEFIKNKAKPLFESWGYKVEILCAEQDYLDLFYHIVTKSKNQERNGRYRGWVIGGRCKANWELKRKPIKDYFRQNETNEEDYIQYVGIAINEPKRLERLRGTNSTSLLEKYNYTEKMAYDLCKRWDLLSSVYNFSKRDGCWFCPNQSHKMFASIKTVYPQLWQELQRLNRQTNLVSQCFRYDETFNEVEKKVDEIIEKQKNTELQISFENLIGKDVLECHT